MMRHRRCLNCGRTKAEDARVTRGQVCANCVYPGQPNPYAVKPDTRPPGEPVVVPDFRD